MVKLPISGPRQQGSFGNDWTTGLVAGWLTGCRWKGFQGFPQHAGADEETERERESRPKHMIDLMMD